MDFVTPRFMLFAEDLLDSRKGKMYIKTDHNNTSFVSPTRKGFLYKIFDLKGHIAKYCRKKPAY